MHDKVLQAATECIGTPFIHQGRVIGRGLDCVGLLAHIFESLELPYADEKGYPRSPYDGKLESNLDSQQSLRRIDRKDAQAGDVLVMRMKTSPQHIAIHAGEISGHTYIIHASSEHGFVVHHRLDNVWRTRIMRAYRITGGDA